jgi:TPR repeat protein
LGYIYAKQQDFENAKKYYLMGIENGNSYSILCLGDLYKKQKDYENAKKYYLMGIDSGYLKDLFKNRLKIVEEKLINNKKKIN